jgi:hypothetical protein
MVFRTRYPSRTPEISWITISRPRAFKVIAVCVGHIEQQIIWAVTLSYAPIIRAAITALHFCPGCCRVKYRKRYPQCETNH